MYADIASADLHGVYPWNAGRRVRTSNGVYGSDTKAQIALCLGCTMSRCVNCLERNGSPYERKTTRKDRVCRLREKVASMLKEGVRYKDVCSELNISESTYWRYVAQIRKQEKTI